MHRIGPGTRDALVGRTQGGGQLSQARTAEVNGVALLEGRAGRGSEVERRIGLPEFAADDLGHLDVVGLEACVDGADLFHRLWIVLRRQGYGQTAERQESKQLHRVTFSSEERNLPSLSQAKNSWNQRSLVVPRVRMPNP